MVAVGDHLDLLVAAGAEAGVVRLVHVVLDAPAGLAADGTHAAVFLGSRRPRPGRVRQTGALADRGHVSGE